MITYLRSTNYRPEIKEKTALQPGSWVRCEKPNEAELRQLEAWGMDAEILADSLDPHEIPRVQLESRSPYFRARRPGTGNNFSDFTKPLLFALDNEHIVTVSRESLGRFWQPFSGNNSAPTAQQTRRGL